MLSKTGKAVSPIASAATTNLGKSPASSFRPSRSVSLPPVAQGIQRTPSFDSVRRSSSFADTLLPHIALDKEQHQQLRRILGNEAYTRLAQTRHREGLCHADTTRQMIWLANSQTSAQESMTSKLIDVTDRLRENGLEVFAQPLGVLLNLTVPFGEMLKKNSYRYSKNQLLEKGVPEDCVGVVVSAWQGALDPESEQAKTAKTSFDIGELGDANHAFIVLHVDQDKREVLCCDLDPARFDEEEGKEKDVFFKVSKEMFNERVIPFAVMAIRKRTGEAA